MQEAATARTQCPHNRGSAETQAAPSLRWEDEAALHVLLLEQQSALGPALLERRVRAQVLELERRVRAQVLELERGPATEQGNPTLLFLHDECRRRSRTPARRSPASQPPQRYSRSDTKTSSLHSPFVQLSVLGRFDAICAPSLLPSSHRFGTFQEPDVSHSRIMV